MKNILYGAVCLLSMTCLSNNLYAQDTYTNNHTIGITIPEVALLDIEPAASKDITMDFLAPSEAGLALAPPADNNSLWLNYSSIVTDGTGPDASRTISVKLDAIIPGIDIKVTAGAAAGSGAGTRGTPAGPLTLTATDQEIITGIGSCYTGDGATNGNNLTYNVSANTTAYNNILALTNTATVTYTISDN